MGRQLGQIQRFELDSSEMWKLERNHPESGQFSVFNWWLAAPLRRSLRSAILLLQPPSLPQYQSHFSFLCHKKISFHKLTICRVISLIVGQFGTKIIKTDNLAPRQFGARTFGTRQFGTRTFWHQTFDMIKLNLKDHFWQNFGQKFSFGVILIRVIACSLKIGETLPFLQFYQAADIRV